MKGMAIITKKSSSELKKILMNMDNTFGFLGSGGYKVEEKGKIGDIFIIYFTQLDCVSAKIYPAFILDGAIYATKITGAIIGTLAHEGIRFMTKPNTDLPDFIEKYLEHNIGKNRKSIT